VNDLRLSPRERWFYVDRAGAVYPVG
jgi:hypothetical protein